MKLVELLARELDAWPEGVVYICQDGEPEGRRIIGFSVKPDGGSYWSSPRGRVWDMSSAYKSSDYKTAIITRADWQAERERIAGNAADEQQQPQQEQEEMTPCEKLGYKVGDLFELITDEHGSKSGQKIELYFDDGSDAPKFLANPCTFDNCDGKPGAYFNLSIVRKITDKPTVTVNIEITDDDPRTMRDRILEIDRTTEALEEERVQLVQRLADEGFVLARVDAKVAPVEDMSDWRNWREGDLVECVSDEVASCERMTVGEKYEVGFDSGDTAIRDNDGDYMVSVVKSDRVRWHSRPAA